MPILLTSSINARNPREFLNLYFQNIHAQILVPFFASIAKLGTEKGAFSYNSGFKTKLIDKIDVSEVRSANFEIQHNPSFFAFSPEIGLDHMYDDMILIRKLNELWDRVSSKSEGEAYFGMTRNSGFEIEFICQKTQDFGTAEVTATAYINFAPKYLKKKGSLFQSELKLSGQAYFESGILEEESEYTAWDVGIKQLS